MTAGTYFAAASTYSAKYSESRDGAAYNLSALHRLQQMFLKGQTGRPAFLSDGYAMLLCRVALGKATAGTYELRRPPPGFDSVSSSTDPIYAVFDNNQSYPEYILHYSKASA